MEFLFFPLHKYKEIEFMKENNIITILNALLDKIFVGAKRSDYDVHFVEKELKIIQITEEILLFLKKQMNFFNTLIFMELVDLSF